MTTQADDVLTAENPTGPTVVRQPWEGRAIEWLVVAAACTVVLVGLAPQYLLTDSFPLGTDLTGHAVVAWLDARDPLAFLPGAWSQASFNGFAVNQLYPWLPTYFVGLLSLVVPLAVALKVVAALPLIVMPWASWRAGRWAALPQPMPLMMSVATIPFVFDTSCGSCGGTVQATLNGEYSFAWGMAFAILALGAVDRLARRGVGFAAAVLASVATSFSHPLPSLWLAVGVVVIGIGREVWADARRLAPFLTAAVAAMLLAALWWIPFATLRDWMPSNPLIRDGSVWEWLTPASAPWEAVIMLLALAGLVLAARRRAWLLIALGVGAAVALAAFLRFTDGGPFYSIRVLPFWHYGRWMLAAVGFAWAIDRVVTRLRSDRRLRTDPRLAPLVWLTAAVVIVGTTWGWWAVKTPATTSSDGMAAPLGLEVPITAVSTIQAPLAGFAARSDYRELQAVQKLLREVGTKNGCGTLMWDNGDPTLEGGPVFGDAQVFWQSAIWTDGCIPSADGVLVDSSMTAPGMIMTKSLVSQTIEPLLPGRPEFALNLKGGGAERMQQMGIRYYLTHGGEPAAQAADVNILSKVASAGTWEIWEVEKGVPVVSLNALPAVFEPRLGNSDWEKVSNRYFGTSSFGQVPMAQDGLSNWPRAGLSGLPTAQSIEPAGVTDIVLGEGSVSFRVARVGSPVIVRVSAFPGWEVVGAEGPYRATANYMVVIPTSNDVTLTKARTWADWAGIVCALLGLALTVGMLVYRVLQERSRRRASALDDPLNPNALASSDEGEPHVDRVDSLSPR